MLFDILIGVSCLAIGWLTPQPQWFKDGWAWVKAKFTSTPTPPAIPPAI